MNYELKSSIILELLIPNTDNRKIKDKSKKIKVEHKFILLYDLAITEYIVLNYFSFSISLIIATENY